MPKSDAFLGIWLYTKCVTFTHDSVYYINNIIQTILYETYYKVNMLSSILYRSYYIDHILLTILYDTYYMNHIIWTILYVIGLESLIGQCIRSLILIGQDYQPHMCSICISTIESITS